MEWFISVRSITVYQFYKNIFCLKLGSAEKQTIGANNNTATRRPVTDPVRPAPDSVRPALGGGRPTLGGGRPAPAGGRPTLEELRKLALDAIIRPAIEKKKTLKGSSSEKTTSAWETISVVTGPVTSSSLRPSARPQSEGTAVRDSFLLSDLNTRDIVYQDILEEETTTFKEEVEKEVKIEVFVSFTIFLS